MVRKNAIFLNARVRLNNATDTKSGHEVRRARLFVRYCQLLSMERRLISVTHTNKTQPTDQWCYWLQEASISWSAMKSAVENGHSGDPKSWQLATSFGKAGIWLWSAPSVLSVSYPFRVSTSVSSALIRLLWQPYSLSVFVKTEIPSSDVVSSVIVSPGRHRFAPCHEHSLSVFDTFHLQLEV